MGIGKKAVIASVVICLAAIVIAIVASGPQNLASSSPAALANIAAIAPGNTAGQAKPAVAAPKNAAANAAGPATNRLEVFTYATLREPMSIPGVGEMRGWIVWAKGLRFPDLDRNKELQLVLKSGKKVTRAGWTSDGMLFLYADPSDDDPPTKLLYKGREVAVPK